MNLFELKKQRQEALDKADSLVAAAENAKRPMTETETKSFDEAIAAVNALTPQIDRIESLNTLHAKFPKGQIIPAAPGSGRRVSRFNSWQVAEYAEAFAAWAASRGRVAPEALQLGADDLGGVKFPAISAASYEGGATSGASIVPVVIEQQIVPLAPPEFGVEALATVIPTSMDMKFPRKKAHGTAAFKAEGDGTGTNVFTGTDAQTEQFTLGANMIGHPEDASWELLQDVPVFQAFLQDDVLLSLAVLKESKYIAGSGTGEPQGLNGNVGAGVTGVAAGTDGYASELFDATFDVMGKLNAVYHPRAAWLMQRATSIVIRKAQSQANKFVQVFTRVGNQDYLHGYPVQYSTSVDAVATLKTPVYFGDFKAGYIIGLRGGAGVNIKILDQPKALEGLLTVLGYQRVDGRVRRSEAIQGISLA